MRKKFNSLCTVISGLGYVAAEIGIGTGAGTGIDRDNGTGDKVELGVDTTEGIVGTGMGTGTGTGTDIGTEIGEGEGSVEYEVVPG